MADSYLMYDFNVELLTLIGWDRNLCLTMLSRKLNGIAITKLDF